MAEPFASFANAEVFTAYARQAAIKPGHVVLRSTSDRTLSLSCRLGPDTINPVGGFASWDTLTKPTATMYGGRAPLLLPVCLVIGKAYNQESIEPQLKTLERMMGLYTKDGGKPPTLIIEGPGIPHAYGVDPVRRWVTVGDPDWQRVDKLRTGQRCLVRVGITLQTLAHAEEMPDPKSQRRVSFAVPDSSWTGAQVAKAFRLSWPALRKLNPSLKADNHKKLKRGTLVRVA